MGFVVLLAVFAGGIGVLWYSASVSRARKGATATSPRSARVTAAAVAGEAAPVPVISQAPPEPPPLALLTPGDLTPDAVQRLDELAGTMPRPRAVLAQLLHAGDDPQALTRVVATDPSTAALLLRTVNSAQFGLSREITSVQHAITYLGANLVRDIAIRHTLALPPAAADSAVERVQQALWAGSYLASAIAFALAQQLRMSSASDLSTQTLLVGLGDLALVSHYAPLAALYATQASLGARVAAAQEQVGLNAALVGAHLADVWQLPHALRDVLAASLCPLATEPDAMNVALLPPVTLAYFSNRLGEVLAVQPWFELREALDALGHQADSALLPDYLAAAHLEAASAVLLDPAVERRLAAVHRSVRPAGG